jgi:hypothetical protein
MAIHSVDDFLSLINQQVKLQENLRECLVKISAMISVAQGNDLLNETCSTIYHYLWVMNDVMTHACKLNEQALNALITLTEEDL